MCGVGFNAHFNVAECNRYQMSGLDCDIRLHSKKHIFISQSISSKEPTFTLQT